MKKNWLYFLLALSSSVGISAQTNTKLLHNDRSVSRNTPTTIIPEWAPFYHGVASGDPLADRVIIWTRVTPEEMTTDPIEVNWKVATDILLENVVQEGTFVTTVDRDFTVKVDVAGLEAGTTYYYGFHALGKNSLTGKTKTTPSGDQSSHLKFGVISCSNYQAGYFNGYQRLARRNDLDAIIHLGDYIYEYADGVYGDSTLFEDRPLEPATEILSLEDYRTRYSLYRLDTNLIRAHQQHPFITIWDDHESANDSYADGAQNHNEATEGTWETRKAISKQVYFEWMPIRDNAEQAIYRTIHYGNLMDLILLDTRLEGREEQIEDITNPEINDPNRTLLGAAQKQWFFEQLSGSTAKWKVIGQQVIFSELHVGWASLAEPSVNYYQVESLFTDIWDGYPAERTEVITFIDTNEINNTVILTGDFHSTFAYDVVDMPVDVSFQTLPVVGEAPFYAPNANYNAVSGEGSIAVEFACPSITSANFDENTDLTTAQLFQSYINAPFAPFPGIDLGTPNPHMKYVDLIQHGYFILDVKADSAQANWYYTPIDALSDMEMFGEAWYTFDGENHLRQALTESAPKVELDEPAPDDPPMLTGLKEITAPNFAILSLFPNPATDTSTLHYSLAEPALLQIGLYDTNGMQVREFLNDRMPAGVFSLRFETKHLTPGTYICRILANDKAYTAKLVVGK